jgi:hypothetical protein
MKLLPLTAIFAYCDTTELKEEFIELGSDIPTSQAHYKLTDCSMGKNGIYLDKGKGWAECDGIAVEIKKSDFDYALNNYNYRERPLRDIEYQSLKTVHEINYKLLQGASRDLFYNEKQRRYLRELTVDTFIFMMKD